MMLFKKKNDAFPAILLGSLIGIFGVHIIALVESLYYTFWWLDIVLHFAGGFWAGSFLFYLYYYSFRESFRASFPLAVFIIVSGAAFVGIGWEIFEFAMDAIHVPFLGIGLSGKALLADTLLDLIMDVAGALFAALFFLWRKTHAS
ncbi:MAG: hypothetical protein Q8O83_03930 [bacterium]|nr:hypothetical protein [bacterium]